MGVIRFWFRLTGFIWRLDLIVYPKIDSWHPYLRFKSLHVIAVCMIHSSGRLHGGKALVPGRCQRATIWSSSWTASVPAWTGQIVKSQTGSPLVHKFLSFAWPKYIKISYYPSKLVACCWSKRIGESTEESLQWQPSSRLLTAPLWYTLVCFGLSSNSPCSCWCF